MSNTRGPIDILPLGPGLPPPLCPAHAFSDEKPTAAKLKAWRASLMRSRHHLLGVVYPSDDKPAKAASIAEFKVRDDMRRRPVILPNDD